MINQLLDRFVRKPPVFFPLVALFHLVMLAVTTWGFASQSLLQSRQGIISCGVWLLYSIVWLFVCAMKRWAAMTYIVISLLSLGFQFFLPKGSIWYDAGTVLFPFDLLMIVFLLFYYKRFE